MPDTNTPPPRIPVSEAFAALPLQTPPRSAWPEVAQRVRGPRRRRTRVAGWLAVAASAALLAFWLPRPGGPEGARAPTGLAHLDGSPPGASAAGLDDLLQRSQVLEARLQAEPPALRSGSAVLAAEFIAADIGRIDAALAAAPPEDTALLWQARVALLVELDGLRRTEMLAASGGGALPALD